MYKILVLLFLIFTFYSCSKQEIKVDPISIQEEKNGSEFISAPNIELQDTIISINETVGEQ